MPLDHPLRIVGSRNDEAATNAESRARWLACSRHQQTVNAVNFRRSLLTRLAASLTAWALMIGTLLIPWPALAMVSQQPHLPITIGTMSNKADAMAKKAEGRL